MSEPSEFGKEAKRLTEVVRGLAATHDALVDTVREIQAVMLFDTHDDLVQLDGELDNVYPEAFE